MADIVLVWESHGDITVYDVNTLGNLKKVADMVFRVVEGWGCGDVDESTYRALEAQQSLSSLKKFLQDFVREVGVDSDDFEHFEFSYLR